MGVEANFSLKAIEAQMLAAMQPRLDAVIQTFMFVGERFVTNVRTKIVADESYRALMRKIPRREGGKKIISQATPRYEDDTANLTSSVGYLILQEGEVIATEFDGESSTGKTVGEAAAKEIASLHPTGIVLVVVAGMQYAAAVESLGYDVLTGSSFVAERELREALKALQN